MTRRAFTILLVLTVISAAAATVVTIRGEGTTAPLTKPEIVFPGLTQRLNDVARVEIVRAGEKTTLKREGQGENAPWVLVEAANYPGKIDRIREALIGIAQLETVEPKTRLPDHYSKLDVEDPSQAGAKGARVTLFDGANKQLADLIVGKPKLGGGSQDALYIRRPDEARAWLARGKVYIPENRYGWVDTNMLTVDLLRIKRATINQPGKPPLSVFKNDPSERDFTIENQPPNSEIKDIFGAEDIARIVQSVNFEDVKPASEMDVPTDGTPWGEFWTFDGLKISLWMREVDGKGWVAYQASAAEGATPDEKVQAEIADLNKRLSPWRYQLGSFEYNGLHKTMADLVEIKKAEAPAPGAPVRR
ncbi:MAG: DUF4340 domain-containing protein [Gemmatimonas sp.]